MKVIIFHFSESTYTLEACSKWIFEFFWLFFFSHYFVNEGGKTDISVHTSSITTQAPETTTEASSNSNGADGDKSDGKGTDFWNLRKLA